MSPARSLCHPDFSWEGLRCSYKAISDHIVRSSSTISPPESPRISLWGGGGLQLSHRLLQGTWQTKFGLVTWVIGGHGFSQVLWSIVLVAEPKPNRDVLSSQGYEATSGSRARTRISGSTTWAEPAFSKQPRRSWTPLGFHNLLPGTQSSLKAQSHLCLWMPAKLLWQTGHANKRLPMLPPCWHRLHCQFKLVIVFPLDQC